MNITPTIEVSRVKLVYNSFHVIFPFSNESKARFHVSSSLAPLPNGPGPTTHSQCLDALPTDWLVYEEMSRGQRLANVRCCTVVTPITVALFAGTAKLPQENVQCAENGVVIGDFNQGPRHCE